MACEHHGGRAPASGGSIPTHPDVPERDTPPQRSHKTVAHTCLPLLAHGEAGFPMAQRTGWVSQSADMSLRLLTDRRAGAVGKYGRLSPSLWKSSSGTLGVAALPWGGGGGVPLMPASQPLRLQGLMLSCGSLLDRNPQDLGLHADPVWRGRPN